MINCYNRNPFEEYIPPKAGLLRMNSNPFASERTFSAAPPLDRGKTNPFGSPTIVAKTGDTITNSFESEETQEAHCEGQTEIIVDTYQAPAHGNNPFRDAPASKSAGIDCKSHESHDQGDFDYSDSSDGKTTDINCLNNNATEDTGAARSNCRRTATPRTYC